MPDAWSPDSGFFLSESITSAMAFSAGDHARSPSLSASITS